MTTPALTQASSASTQAPSADFQHFICLEEVPRDYRTEIPNIVIHMFEQGLISHTDLIFYLCIRKIAGPNGGCWMGVRKLEEKLKMADKTIAKCKQALSQPFAILNGKPLITVFKSDKKTQKADIMKITDVWPENHMFFKKFLRDVNEGAGGVVNEGAQEGTSFKKEPKKGNDTSRTKRKNDNEEGNTYTVRETNPPSVPSLSTETPVPVPFSVPFLLDGDGDSTEGIDKDVVSLASGLFKETDLTTWIRKFGKDRLVQNLKYFHSLNAEQKNKVRNVDTWMEKALKENYAEKNQNKAINREYAIQMQYKYQLKSLTIKESYCLYLGKDFSFNLPEQTFKEALDRVLESRFESSNANTPPTHFKALPSSHNRPSRVNAPPSIKNSSESKCEGFSESPRKSSEEETPKEKALNYNERLSKLGGYEKLHALNSQNIEKGRICVLWPDAEITLGYYLFDLYYSDDMFHDRIDYANKYLDRKGC